MEQEEEMRQKRIAMKSAADTPASHPPSRVHKEAAWCPALPAESLKGKPRQGASKVATAQPPPSQ
eukprot:57271-Pyramimonas_sp.AAC.2